MATARDKRIGKRNSKNRKPSAVVTRRSFFGGFAVKRRFRIDQNVKESRPIFRLSCIKKELHSISDEFFEVRIDRVIDATETTHGLAFSRYRQRQARGTVRTN
jgi:hypothetical protein